MKKTVVWLVLAAIVLSLCGCGGKNEKNSAEPAEKTVADTEKNEPEPTAEPTPRPTEEATMAPTEAPTPEPREDKNGFNKETNTVLSLAGIDFSIPGYYEKEDVSDEESVLFSIGDVAALALVCIENSNNSVSEEDLDEFGTDEWKAILKIIYKTNDVNAVLFEGTEKGQIAGFPAVFCKATGKSTGGKYEFLFSYILNDSKNQIVYTLFAQDSNALYDYLPDCERILQNAAPAKEDDAVSSELRAFLDSYEAVMNEYCDFMEKFSENSSDLSYLMKYADMLAKYSDMAEKADEWEEKDMSDADTAYYLEVMARVSKRLLEAGTGMF